MMDLETLRRQAEARWPLGWEIAEAVLTANPGPLTIVLDYADDPPTLSCYTQAQPLIDGDPFSDLDAALQDAAAAWQRLVALVPPLMTTPGAAARPAASAVEAATHFPTRGSADEQIPMTIGVEAALWGVVATTRSAKGIHAAAIRAAQTAAARATAQIAAFERVLIELADDGSTDATRDRLAALLTPPADDAADPPAA